MNKKARIEIVLGVLIGLVIVLGILAVTYYNQSITARVIDGGDLNQIPNQNSSQKNCYEKQFPYEEPVETIEYYPETVPRIDNVCVEEEIPYKIENLVMDYDRCNDYDEVCHEKNWWGICTDKEAYCVDRSLSCSLDLTNLDNKEQGVWKIKFLFYEQGTADIIKEEEVYGFLYPQTTEKFRRAVRIVSSNPEEDANKNLRCDYRRIDVPKKQVCKEVTKYEEVQRKKVVVKPTTKYKTETICE